MNLIPSAQHADASFNWFVPNRPHTYTIFPVLMMHLSKLIQRKRHLVYYPIFNNAGDKLNLNKILPGPLLICLVWENWRKKNIASDYIPSTENDNCWNDVIKLFFSWYDQFDWPNTGVVIFSIPLYINDIRSLALISSDLTHSSIYQ